jgi:hypothetical protein
MNCRIHKDSIRKLLNQPIKVSNEQVANCSICLICHRRGSQERSTQCFYYTLRGDKVKSNRKGVYSIFGAKRRGILSDNPR